MYYQKLIKRLGDCETGEYVYDEDARLCYVEKESDEDGDTVFKLHSYAIVSTRFDPDAEVYPISLVNDDIMERMRAHRDKYHKANIMNPDFSRELEGKLSEIMHLDVHLADYKEKCREFWKSLDDRFEGLMMHARALGLRS